MKLVVEFYMRRGSSSLDNPDDDGPCGVVGPTRRTNNSPVLKSRTDNLTNG